MMPITWIRHKAVTTVAAAVVLAGVVTVLLAACRHASAPSHARQLRSLFTGEPVPSLTRVPAVKIDNIVNARPQTGLTHAGTVYVLPVEGGLSRILRDLLVRLPALPPAGRLGRCVDGWAPGSCHFRGLCLSWQLTHLPVSELPWPGAGGSG